MIKHDPFLSVFLVGMKQEPKPGTAVTIELWIDPTSRDEFYLSVGGGDGDVSIALDEMENAVAAMLAFKGRSMKRALLALAPDERS